MMSLQTKLSTIKTALTGIQNLSVYHYFAPSSATIPYCVWNEDGEEGSLQTDNHKVEQRVSGYVEYFTKTEFDTMFDTIQTTLNGIDGLYWEWESTIYGDPLSEDNNTLHHTWSWRFL